MRAAVLVSLVVSPLVIACAPTFAPPIRTVHGGAPGRLDPGDMELGLGSAGLGYVPGGMGGGSVGYAARPHLTVEGGVDGGSAWTLGWGGVRVPGRWRLREPWLGVAVDGEAGVGAGVGGSRC
ncbi:MAG: hypothetical protein KDK70_22190, partial [Myxococcales bacterium]|nr:hypothetical protein [Myxococcales bacterium]